MARTFTMPTVTLRNATGEALTVTVAAGVLSITSATISPAVEFALSTYATLTDLVAAINADTTISAVGSGVTASNGGAYKDFDPSTLDWASPVAIADAATGTLATRQQASSEYTLNIARLAGMLGDQRGSTHVYNGDSFVMTRSGRDRYPSGWMFRAMQNLVTGARGKLTGWFNPYNLANTDFAQAADDLTPGNIGNATAPDDFRVGPVGNQRISYVPAGNDIYYLNGADLDGAAGQQLMRGRARGSRGSFPDTNPAYEWLFDHETGQRYTFTPVIHFFQGGPTALRVEVNGGTNYTADLSDAQDNSIVPLLNSGEHVLHGNGSGLPGNGNHDIDLPSGQEAFGNPSSTGTLPFNGYWNLKTDAGGTDFLVGTTFAILGSESASLLGAAENRDPTAEDDKTWNFRLIREWLESAPAGIRNGRDLYVHIVYATEALSQAEYADRCGRIADNWQREGKAAGYERVFVVFWVPPLHRVQGPDGLKTGQSQQFINYGNGVRDAITSGRQSFVALIDLFQRSGGWRFDGQDGNTYLVGDQAEQNYSAFDINNDGVAEDLTAVDLLDGLELHPASNDAALLFGEFAVQAVREGIAAGDFVADTRAGAGGSMSVGLATGMAIGGRR